MRTYRITFAVRQSQHKNATVKTKEIECEAVSAQDAVYITTINESAGQNIFFAVVNIQLIPEKSERSNANPAMGD